jgi:hypothetical protein
MKTLRITLAFFLRGVALILYAPFYLSAKADEGIQRSLAATVRRLLPIEPIPEPLPPTRKKPGPPKGYKRVPKPSPAQPTQVVGTAQTSALIQDLEVAWQANGPDSTPSPLTEKPLDVDQFAPVIVIDNEGDGLALPKEDGAA